MGAQKIDRKKLHDMLTGHGTARKTQKECAAYFGVSEVAIWKAKKELNLAVVKDVTMEAGHRVVESHLDTVGQLQKINQKTNLILDGLMKEIKKGGAAEDTRKLREVALKASQEIRGQLSLQLEIFRTLYDVTAICQFQGEVIALISQANKSPCCEGEVVCAKCGQKVDLRSLIIQRLKAARALRSGVTFKP
jgi:hypothetical protein